MDHGVRFAGRQLQDLRSVAADVRFPSFIAKVPGRNDDVRLMDVPGHRMIHAKDTSTMIIVSDAIFTLESLVQAAIIFIMGVAIIVANVLIIATFVNFRGKMSSRETITESVINYFLRLK